MHVLVDREKENLQISMEIVMRKLLCLEDCLVVNSRLSGGGRSKKRRDDGTLSRRRICKLLYGPSQGNETGD